MKPILPFKWRRGIHKFLQTQEEKNLEDKTLEAMDKIAEALDISKEEYQDKLPIVKHNPNAKSCSWNRFKKEICYKVDQDISIYEETGHYLADFYGSEDTGNLDAITTFFKMSLSEGVGYFCSNLSGTKRKDRFMYLPKYNHQRREALDQINPDMIEKDISQEIKEKVTENFKKKVLEELDKDEYIEEKGMALYKIVNKYTEDESELKELTDLLEQIPTRSSSLEIIQKYLPEDLKDLGKNMFALPQADMGLYQRFYHLIGYDLGDEVSELYNQDKKEGQRILKRMMKVRREKSISEFFKLQKEMQDLGYSPIILDVEDLLIKP